MEVALNGEAIMFTFKPGEADEQKEYVALDKIVDVAGVFGEHENDTIAVVNLTYQSMGTCYPQIQRINLFEVTNQPTWTVDRTGVDTARDEIAGWVWGTT